MPYNKCPWLLLSLLPKQILLLLPHTTLLLVVFCCNTAKSSLCTLICPEYGASKQATGSATFSWHRNMNVLVKLLGNCPIRLWDILCAWFLFDMRDQKGNLFCISNETSSSWAWMWSLNCYFIHSTLRKSWNWGILLNEPVKAPYIFLWVVPHKQRCVCVSLSEVES